jgi:hypothetical protein
LCNFCSSSTKWYWEVLCASFAEVSFEVKLSKIGTDEAIGVRAVREEKRRRKKSEEKGSEERRSRRAKR